MSIDSIEPSWVTVESVCQCYGVSYPVALNRISVGTFPVPTYKVGKRRVIDRAVHDEYFMKHRRAGLLALDTTNS
jgi:predicted site-specific integrase-resolvase